MRRTPLLAALALLVALTALVPAAHAATGSLVVTKALVNPDADVIHLTITCRAGRARCRGLLSMESEYDGPVTRARAVRLVPRRPTQLTLRLAPGGLAAAGSDGIETYGYVRLRTRTGGMLEASVDLTAHLSCRSGHTLASTERARVFEQAGFGVYACVRPSGPPALIEQTSSNDEQTVAVYDVTIAGPYVAYVTVDSYKCVGYTVSEFDIYARRAVRVRTSFTDDAPSANCPGTSPIDAVVLRPSGSFAWIEGGQGAYTVRGVDATGTHTIGTGAAIDGSSLALAGPATVTWSDGGVPQSGPLG